MISITRPSVICGYHFTPFRLVLALLLMAPGVSWAGGIVTNCTEADFLAVAADGGTVTFACDGTITLSQTFTNSVDTVLDATRHQVTISGNAIRLFVVNSNATLSVLNVTMAQGRAQAGAAILSFGGNIVLNGATVEQNTAVRPSGGWENFPAGIGGGVYLAGGTLSATNSFFSGNRATVPGAAGGAIKNDGGVVSLQGCVFTGNSASGVWDSPPPGSGLPAYGGAIDSRGTLILDACMFVSNYVYGGSSPSQGGGGNAFGGAINTSGRAEINRCSFANNSGSGGNGAAGPDAIYGTGQGGGPGGGGGGASGGAVCNAGIAYVAASTFASNSLSGGYGGRGGNGVTWMDIGTSGGDGGGGGNAKGSAVFNSGALGLVNCTITAGSASGGAGGNGGAGGSGSHGSGSRGRGGAGGDGAGAVAGAAGLTNCTVALNLASYGAGGVGLTAGTNGAGCGGIVASGATLINCLLATNALGNCSGHLNDAGHNLSSDATCALTNTGSMNATDPKLAPLAAYGGPTLTMALLQGSPAIDAADTAAAPPSDQRGFARPAGVAADIGAYEYGVALWLRPSLNPGGDMIIRAYGPPGQTCRLFSSADFSNWLPMATNRFGAEGSVVFYDQAHGLAQRFYRAVSP